MYDYFTFSDAHTCVLSLIVIIKSTEETGEQKNRGIGESENKGMKE